MAEDTALLEGLAKVFHDAWWHWSESVAPDIKDAERVARWKEYWVEYDNLDESTKDLDREWAKEAMKQIKPYLDKAKMAKEMVTRVEVDSEKYPGLANVLAAGEEPPKEEPAELDPFTRMYLETALWAETDQTNEQGGEPLDKNFSIEDFSPEALESAKADCKKFQADNATDLAGQDLEAAGHDFWLTRNHHGAGFWDGDYPKEIGERLTEASHQYPEKNIYVGDDKKLQMD
jgi:hypothetical protein